ncbi:phage head closure protein [Stenotrophomonas rhizophila]|uniref:phage head closure protein n=1 Tax=Stenotrophomonas rhizophila TaxID=216778 RepID=UPI0028D2688D|nr:phage head closure protein [Stenotrophomonas rhizophila]
MRRAGKYRHRITLQEFTVSRDPLGGDTKAWVDWHKDVPAEVVPLSGREFTAASAEHGQVTARMEIPYLPGVLNTMRVTFDGQAYAIRAALPDPTARSHINLMVDAGVSDG